MERSDSTGDVLVSAAKAAHTSDTDTTTPENNWHFTNRTKAAI